MLLNASDLMEVELFGEVETAFTTASFSFYSPPQKIRKKNSMVRGAEYRQPWCRCSVFPFAIPRSEAYCCFIWINEKV